MIERYRTGSPAKPSVPVPGHVVVSWRTAKPLARLMSSGLFALLVTGCGTADTDVISIPDPQVTVITLQGEQRAVSTADLYDPKTGQPAVRSVLVIDRQSNQSVFIDLDRLSDRSQMDSRYILKTDHAEGEESPGIHSRR